MDMGLITLVLLAAFAMLYLSKSIGAKSEIIAGIVAKIEENLDQFTLWSAVYGLAGAVLSLTMDFNGSDMFIRFFANVMIVILASPFVFDKICLKLPASTNPIIIRETGNVIKFVSRNEKYFGYIAAAAAGLLFAAVFK